MQTDGPRLRPLLSSGQDPVFKHRHNLTHPKPHPHSAFRLTSAPPHLRTFTPKRTLRFPATRRCAGHPRPSRLFHAWPVPAPPPPRIPPPPSASKPSSGSPPISCATTWTRRLPSEAKSGGNSRSHTKTRRPRPHLPQIHLRHLRGTPRQARRVRETGTGHQSKLERTRLWPLRLAIHPSLHPIRRTRRLALKTRSRSPRRTPLRHRRKKQTRDTGETPMPHLPYPAATATAQAL